MHEITLKLTDERIKFYRGERSDSASQYSSYELIKEAVESQLKPEPQHGELCRVWNDGEESFRLQVYRRFGRCYSDFAFLNDEETMVWDHIEPTGIIVDIEASRSQNKFVRKV